MSENLCIGPIPDHLTKHAWYAPHQAWLRDRSKPHHNPGDAEPQCANLARAYLAGAYLAGANLARADLAGANLARADLADANLARAYLADAYLADADLAGAYLAGANLAGADLADAYLAGADLAGAKGLPPDFAQQVTAKPLDVPIVPHIDAAILSAVEGDQARGTLDMSTWHRDGHCGTTHCRAGWAVVIAGERGLALEKEVGPHRAGTLIYRASRPGKPAPHFFATTERALADLRRCAAEDPLPEEAPHDPA
jgi:hypothetical protein